MIVNLKEIFVTQRRISRFDVVEKLVSEIKEGNPITPIFISEMDEDVFRIEDGTHRGFAYLICGKYFLKDGEFQIVPFNFSRQTVGKLTDISI